MVRHDDERGPCVVLPLPWQEVAVLHPEFGNQLVEDFDAQLADNFVLGVVLMFIFTSTVSAVLVHPMRTPASR